MLKPRDEQWERIREHFPEENIPDSHPGRKPIPTRRVLEAVLWILNTGAQWHMLPQGYPNYKNSGDAASITGQAIVVDGGQYRVRCSPGTWGQDDSEIQGAANSCHGLLRPSLSVILTRVAKEPALILRIMCPR